MTQEQTRLCRFQALVEGRVQGVGFRYYTVERAESLGLDGYVRNRWDRTVEVVAEGPEPEINAFLAWLREGPPLAQVTRVNVHWLTPTGEHTGFEVAY